MHLDQIAPSLGASTNSPSPPAHSLSRERLTRRSQNFPVHYKATTPTMSPNRQLSFTRIHLSCYCLALLLVLSSLILHAPTWLSW